MPTKISLITTVYNRDRYLAQTLDSILAQTYPHFELLIWDDGSTDRSIDIARQYTALDSRIRVIQSPQNQGFPNAVKAAISSTAAPYFGWVDSDDLLAPTALAETVAVLDAHPQVGLVYTNHLLIDEHGNDRGLGRQCRIPYSKDRLLVDFMVFHFRLIRRSCYEQVGGIDTTIACAEDYDLCLKLSEVTEIHHLPRPLYFYRRHADNVTNNQIEVIRSAQQAIENALERRGLHQSYKLKITPTFSLRQKPAVPDDTAPRLPKIAPVPLDPLVSIVIPAYNAAPRLAYCLQSCFAQTYPNLEILLVDNGSTDDTVAIAKTLLESGTRPFRILHCKELGANAARNWGMAQAQGDYIQWLDADDELAPDKILKQVMALIQQPEIDIAYGDWDWCFFEQRQAIVQLRFCDQAYEDMTLQMLIDNWRPPHAYLLRRRAALQLHQLEAWNPETRVYMDREYFTIAALLGLRFSYVPDSFVCYYRWSRSQVSRMATYSDRVLNRHRIFRRFQDIARLVHLRSSSSSLCETHQFLLVQSWDLWQPTFTRSHLNAQTGVLYHPQDVAELHLTPQEANIVWAFLQTPEPRTLEDHTRKILQVLWLEILHESYQAESSLDYDVISEKLAWRVGTHPHSQTSDMPDLRLSSADPAQSKQMLHPLLQEVPLFTPLFGKERLQILRFLARLRQQGWLQQNGTRIKQYAPSS